MLPPSSAREMLMQVKRYADGGDVSSVGLAKAISSGLTQTQYDDNIRAYIAKTSNPLEALNAATENGVSMADINRALGTQAATDYFTTDYNTETAPSTNVATGFTSQVAQRYNAPGGPGQSALDKRIGEIGQQYAANTPENAQILRDMFIQEGGSIADLQRAGFDPSRLLGTVAKKPVVPPVTPTPYPQTQTPYTQTQPTYTAPTVYQPLPAPPPPIYAPGQPALDVAFRNSPARTYDPRYGYMYTPAAKLLPATGAGMSFTPPSVTSRPRSLLNVPLPVSQTPKKKWSEFTPEEKASFGLSASQVFAREESEKSSTSPNRFAGQTAPTTPAVDYTTNPNAIEPIEFRFFQKGGPVKKPEGSLAATAPMSQADLLAQIDRSTAATPIAVTPDRDPVKTESAGMLSRLNAKFGRNISQPIVGSAIDMTAGLGDILQMGTKYLANRAGIETQPFTPVSPRIQEAAGTAGYDPYSPAALAASVLLPAAGPLRTAAAATRPMMSMAAAPGSARETLSLIKPILDREASVAASAELAAMGARELAPDNVTAEIAAAIAGGGAYNTLDNILGSAADAPTTSGIAIKLQDKTPKAVKPKVKTPKAGVDVLPPTESAANLAKFLEGSVAPPVVYHSTKSDFDVFSLLKLGRNTKDPTSKIGFFTAADPASTEDFITYPNYRASKGSYEEGANIMPLHLSIKNPVEMSSTDFMLQAMGLQRMKKKDAAEAVQRFIESAKAEGHDGLVIRSSPNSLTKGAEFTSDNWVAFDPSQIKSALGNVGSFDPTSPVITKAQGGYVTRKQDGGTISAPMSNAELLAQIDRSTANSPAPAYGTASSAPRDPVQTDSRNMLERFTSLNTPQDMSLGETLTDIGMGFAPVVGTAQGLRDFERARRDDDTLGMVLGAASAIPIVGGAVKAARTVGKASKAADVLPPTESAENLAKFLEGSSLVDESGKPKVFYHGTPNDFDKFDRERSLNARSRSMDTVGNWFSDNPGKGGAEQYGSTIMPVFLKAKNLKEYSNFDDFLRDMHEAEGRDFSKQNPKGGGSAEGLRAKLKGEGYDGLVFPQNNWRELEADEAELAEAVERATEEYRQESRRLRGLGFEMTFKDGKPFQAKIDRLVDALTQKRRELDGISQEWADQSAIVVFDPTQIKSAIGNKGTFDPTNPVITKAKGGYVTKKTKGA